LTTPQHSRARRRRTGQDGTGQIAERRRREEGPGARGGMERRGGGRKDVEREEGWRGGAALETEGARARGGGSPLRLRAVDAPVTDSRTAAERAARQRRLKTNKQTNKQTNRRAKATLSARKGLSVRCTTRQEEAARFVALMRAPECSTRTRTRRALTCRCARARTGVCDLVRTAVAYRGGAGLADAQQLLHEAQVQALGRGPLPELKHHQQLILR
jgi:hypothetical protein